MSNINNYKKICTICALIHRVSVNMCETGDNSCISMCKRNIHNIVIHTRCQQLKLSTRWTCRIQVKNVLKSIGPSVIL